MNPDASIATITCLCVVFMANLALLQRSITTYMKRRSRLMLVQLTNIFFTFTPFRFSRGLPLYSVPGGGCGQQNLFRTGIV